MGTLRTFFRSHVRLALLLLAVALCARVLVPEGYMPDEARGEITVRICHDGADGQLARLTLPMAETGHGGATGHEDGAGHQPCAFGAVSLGALEGPPPLWVALLFAFILVLGFRAAPLLLRRASDHVRPPLRGPPALS